MATTYIPLYTTTLASAGTVTFSSIPNTYTDLVLVISDAVSIATNTPGACISFNSDTASNYSSTHLEGTGTSALSNRQTNQSNINSGYNIGLSSSSTQPATIIINIMNYANTTTYKTILSRNAQTAGAAPGTGATVGLWRSTAAINSMAITAQTGNFAIGTTFSLYGVASAAVGAKATGGVISSDANYWYHTFTSSGTFTPSQALTCDYLVVAGGGGGGVANFSGNSTSGGGGAGGLRSTVTATGGGGTLETALALASGTSYTVTIGAGGSGSTAQDSDGTNGSNSVFSTITSVGGGYGSSRNAVGTNRNPNSGGSGGGGGLNVNGAAGTTNQGFAGGNPTDTNNSGAGGGGAGGVGGNSGSNVAGVAGLGLAVGISGSLVTYATGGRGRQANPVDGANNTGTGGDGGSTSSGSPTRGGNGGSGLVIVRYPI
jgi:hypothetical protein